MPPILLAIALVIVPALLAAQGNNNELQQLVKQLKTGSTAPTGSVENDATGMYNRVEDAKREQLRLSALQKRIMESDGAWYFPKVVAHYRSPTGLPLPKPEEVKLPLLSEDDSAPMNEFIRGTIEYSRKPPAQPTKPPRCDMNKTVREPIQNALKVEKPRVYIDELYLPAEALPPDPSEAFGNSVRLRFMTGNDADWGSAQMNSVPCYPYRFRITDHYNFYQYGTEAYRNYSANPEGEGEFHHWVKAKLVR